MEIQDPRPLLLRQVIIDMLPYTASDGEILTMQYRLGLVPSSLDVLELDRKESNARIKGLKPVFDSINLLAGYSAEAIAEYFIMQVDDGVTDEESEEGVPIDYLRAVLIKQNTNVIITATLGIVSHLVSSGVLVFNKEHSHGILG